MTFMLKIAHGPSTKLLQERVIIITLPTANSISFRRVVTSRILHSSCLWSGDLVWRSGLELSRPDESLSLRTVVISRVDEISNTVEADVLH